MKTKWTKEELIKEISTCYRIIELKSKNPAAYIFSKKYEILESLKCHLKERKPKPKTKISYVSRYKKPSSKPKSSTFSTVMKSFEEKDKIWWNKNLKIFELHERKNNFLEACI